ncbi:hypothetical protein DPMN_113207 [Dreissena polymorpha]|uniref:Uncharacterized protein n=1 Tax=Dreissena polymorpha TaxID=45954 RepID=A0A9D4KHS3_DREPO|nr:hypothetical protein DPMN_113207 [Dreissena polymorpha]
MMVDDAGNDDIGDDFDNDDVDDDYDAAAATAIVDNNDNRLTSKCGPEVTYYGVKKLSV